MKPAPGKREQSQLAHPLGDSDISKLLRLPRSTEVKRETDPKRIRQRLSINDSSPVQNQSAEVKRSGWKYLTLATFVLIVIVPTICATAYYSWYASNQYVAEFKFMVKDNSAVATAGAGGLLAALGQSLASTNTENYLVSDYLTSRQAVDDLEARIKVSRLYAKPEIDWFSRFDSSLPTERFVTYWQKMVTSHYDQITGTATARVRAFSPEDALLIAQSLVTLAEELVNRMGSRAQSDRVRFAERELERVQERVKKIRLQLMEGRPNAEGGANANLLLDMERQIGQNLLASAMQGLEQARASAAAQHLYITPYVRPSLPASATYPRLFLDPFIVAAIAFAVWLALLLVFRSIFERFY
jgi:capsule polysaccharide export protein KpsE/RkpR